MDFFKEMVEILPPQLEFLTQIFTIIKSMSRNQKPDYPKFIKKTYSALKQKQNNDLGITAKRMMSKNFSMRKFSQQKIQEVSEVREKSLKKSKGKITPQKSVKKLDSQQKSKSKLKQDEEEMLLIIDSDNQDNQLNSKYSKLQTTKCTAKTKSFWEEKVTSDD